MLNKDLLRSTVRSFYDAQKLRIEIGNRIVANVHSTIGREPGQKVIELPEEVSMLLRLLVAEYDKITNVVTDSTTRKLLRYLRSNKGVITNLFEFELVGLYKELVEKENKLLKALVTILEEMPIWNEFLKDVKGCGPLMAAVIISELDPHKARYVSSFWKYCGVDVASDGKGRSRRKEHLETVFYKDKNGEEKQRLSITFNPFLKTKLLRVLAPSFLKCNSPYAQTYYNYKNRLENHPVHKSKTKAHKHNMAIRYMIKQFLRDLYVEWRKLEGLEIHPPYEEAKLGIAHKGVSTFARVS